MFLQNALTSLLARLDWPKIVLQSVGNIASYVLEMASKAEKISVCAYIRLLIKKWLWKRWKIFGCKRTGHQKLCQQDCRHFFSHFPSYRSQSSSSTSSSSGQQLLDGLPDLTSVKEEGPKVWRNPKGFDQALRKTNVFCLETELLQMFFTNQGKLNYYVLIWFWLLGVGGVRISTNWPNSSISK